MHTTSPARDEILKRIDSARAELDALRLLVTGSRLTQEAERTPTALQQAVIQLVAEKWPNGCPQGLRAGMWHLDIEDECARVGIIAGNRTIRRALGGK